MSTLDDILRRAARRHLAHRALARAGLGLAAAVGAGLVLLAADRGLGLGLSWPVWVVLAALGAVAGAASALARPPAAAAVAARIDRTLHLEDRLATAATLETASRRHDPGFAALVRRDADRLAGRLDVRSVTPLHLTGVWAWALGLGAVLLLGSVLLPARAAPDDPGDARPGTSGTPETERAEVASTIEEAVDEVLAEHDDAEPLLDESTREQLEALRDLASQLAAAETDTAAPADEAVDAQAARERSAAELSAVADQLAEQADRDARAADELTRRFAGLESARDEAGVDAPLSTTELAEAIRRGEFGYAADVLEDLLQDGEALSEAERAAAAQQLRELGRQIEDLSSGDPAEADERRQRLLDTLREQGLDEESIDKLLDGAPTDEPAPDAEASDPAEELRRRDVDGEIARRLARELESVRKQNEVDEQVTRDAGQIADALERAAESLENPGPTEKEPAAAAPPTTGNEPPPAPGEQRRDEPGAETPPTSDAETPRPEPGAAETPAPKPGETPEQAPGQTAPQNPAPGRAERAPAAPRDGGPETTETTEKPETSPDGAPRPGTERKPVGDGREGTGAAEPDSGTQVGPRPGSTTDADPRDEAVARPADASQPPDATGTAVDPGAGPDPAAGEPQPAPRPGTAPEGAESQRPVARAAEGTPPDGTGPGMPAATETPPGAEPPAPAEALREIERRRQAAGEQRRLAGRTREAARRLAENMSEDERRRWAEQWRDAGGQAGVGDGPNAAGEPPDPYAPEVGDAVRLEDEDPAGLKLAEWLSDESSGAPGLSGGAPEQIAGRARAARRAAERTVNESAVPSRYHHFIKRYFDRLERGARPAADDATPAPGSEPPSSSDAGGDF